MSVRLATFGPVRVVLRSKNKNKCSPFFCAPSTRPLKPPVGASHADNRVVDGSDIALLIACGSTRTGHREAMYEADLLLQPLLSAALVRLFRRADVTRGLSCVCVCVFQNGVTPLSEH